MLGIFFNKTLRLLLIVFVANACTWIGLITQIVQAQDSLKPPIILKMEPIELSKSEGESLFVTQTQNTHKEPSVPNPTVENPAVEIEILIEETGNAKLLKCAYSVSICKKITTALQNTKFLPAMDGEHAVPSEVTVRWDVTIENTTSKNPPSQSLNGSSKNGKKEVFSFGATAKVAPTSNRPTAKITKVRNLPFAFGDPLRVVETFPGVTPVISGLPYFFVRGAPPSGTLFVYDEMYVPSLYHLAIGPSVIHPAMMGSIKMYSGIAPARYGRFIGGIITSEGPDTPEGTPTLSSEAELRLIDVGGFIQVPVGKGSFSASARFGYPGPLIQLVSSNVDLLYGDYQVRFDLPFGAAYRFQAIGLGSVDEFDDKSSSNVKLQFHRFELRLLRTKGAFQFGAALNLGFEESSSEQTINESEFSLDEIQIESFRLSPRLWGEYKNTWLRTRFGGEIIAIMGKLQTFESPGGLSTSEETDFLRSVAGRGIFSFYAEADLNLHWFVTLELGLRHDIWTNGTKTDASVDPRFRIILHPTKEIDFHAAVGTVHQPAVSSIQVPGLSEIAVNEGLQSAVQFDAGFSFELPYNLTADVQAFFHRYKNLYFPDSFFGPTNLAFCNAGADDCKRLEQSRDGNSYGAEFYLKAEPVDEFGGWLSYTLAWSELDPYKQLPSLTYTPSYDIRHVLNFVFRWNIIAGLNFGGRLHFRSGSPRGFFYSNFSNQINRYEQRLPNFVRADAQLAYQWTRDWGRIRLALEWFNLGLRPEPVGLNCGSQLIAPSNSCPIEFAPAIFIPNVSLRGNF